MATKVKATIRMYRLNELGDCFLLTFATPAAGRRKAARSHVLVDCGSFRNAGPSVARLKQITTQIQADLAGDPLHVVVATHQHNDHVSGFLHCQTDFQNMQVGQVWLSWLDDPRDDTAQGIGKEYHNLRRQLVDVATSLQQVAASRPLADAAAHSVEVLSDMMGFSGFPAAGGPPEVPANAVGVLKTLGKADPEYLKPGRVLDLPGLPAGAVRVHV
ncbi:MAG TPA: MBL fold metallo-hydrolase, partial [Longimicrobiaceae bacterium]|nr:MBL fold metallo-hydrolase [Longimicrobiaceae bacterium]